MIDNALFNSFSFWINPKMEFNHCHISHTCFYKRFFVVVVLCYGLPTIPSVCSDREGEWLVLASISLQISNIKFECGVHAFLGLCLIQRVQIQFESVRKLKKKNHRAIKISTRLLR